MLNINFIKKDLFLLMKSKTSTNIFIILKKNYLEKLIFLDKINISYSKS